MRVRMLRHGPSNGARELRKALGIKALRFEGSRYRPRPTDVILNWGCSQSPFPIYGDQWINRPQNVYQAQNKLCTMEVLEEHTVPIPDFTTDREVAEGWAHDGDTVMCRTLLRASAGRGLVVCEPGDPIPPAPLYTRYFKGTYEFRIHVAGGVVIDRQQKRLRNGHEGDPDVKVRNHGNGWVFCREDVPICPEADLAAINAVGALGLDFGAVDLKANRNLSRVGVLEVNTAPGLEGTSLDIYTEAMRNLVRTKQAEDQR